MGGPRRLAGTGARLPDGAARRRHARLRRRQRGDLGPRAAARGGRPRTGAEALHRWRAPRLRRDRPRPRPPRPRRRAGRPASAARALRLARPHAHPRRSRRAPGAGRGHHTRRFGSRFMILVCGGLADGVTELVCSRLEDCGYPYRLLDLARFPEDYRVAWRWTDSGPEGRIAAADWRLDLDAISGVYARFLGPEDRPPLRGVDPADTAALRAEGDLGLMALLEDLECPVVNRIGGGLSNYSKPYQSLVIRRARMRVPPALVISDPAAVLAFHAEHGEVIYKSASGIRSIVRCLGPDQLARLDLLSDGPAQFQAFVPGRNVRVHTVGEQVFATRIESEAVDYR